MWLTHSDVGYLCRRWLMELCNLVVFFQIVQLPLSPYALWGVLLRRIHLSFDYVEKRRKDVIEKIGERW